MDQHKSRTYGRLPRSSDRGKTYLYFKQCLTGLLDLRKKEGLEDTLRVVTLAAMNNSYVEGTASALSQCGQTIRNRLKRQDPSKFFIANRELVERMRSMGAFVRPMPLAVDTHDEMYYGDPTAAGVSGTRNRKGTNYAYKYATASVLINRQRITVAVVPYAKGPIVEHVRTLLEQLSPLGIRVEYLLFDRGYHSVELMKYLESHKMKYVIQLRGPLKADAGEDRIYKAKGHHKKAERATFRLVTIKENGLLYAFATNLVDAPKEVRSIFRGRWGIETSYRMIRMFLPRTTTKLYKIRVLYFFMAVLLYNQWVLMNFSSRRHEIVEAAKLKVAFFILIMSCKGCG